LAFCGFSLHTTAICIWWFLTLKTFITSPAATQCFSALNQNRTRRNQMDEQEKEIEEILRTFDKAPSPSSENITLADYDFTYEIKDNQLYIDFVNESAHDATYEFSVKGDTLILIGGEGTIGGTYELTKVHDKKADK